MREDWTTVASFQNHLEAILAKSVLDSAGIECWLRDEHFGRMIGFRSIAFGGIKLQVRPEHLATALAVLEHDELSSESRPESGP